MIEFPNVRRLAALRSHGALRYLDVVQACMDDIWGGVEEGRYDVVAYQARHVLLVCLSIRSLAIAGDIEFHEESVGFDLFAGLPPGEVAAALELANEAVDLHRSSAPDWFERLRRYIEDTERVLARDQPLPVLRSPAGPFGLISLVRQWTPLLEHLGLPGAIPPDWTRTELPNGMGQVVPRGEYEPSMNTPASEEITNEG